MGQTLQQWLIFVHPKGFDSDACTRGANVLMSPGMKSMGDLPTRDALINSRTRSTSFNDDASCRSFWSSSQIARGPWRASEQGTSPHTRNSRRISQLPVR